MSNVLIVVTHIEPYVLLRPFRAELHLCVDYYDSGWDPEDGAMFGKEYPGIALGWGIEAFGDAKEYARSEGYSSLVIKRVVDSGVELIFEARI